MTMEHIIGKDFNVTIKGENLDGNRLYYEVLHEGFLGRFVITICDYTILLQSSTGEKYLNGSVEFEFEDGLIHYLFVTLRIIQDNPMKGIVHFMGDNL